MNVSTFLRLVWKEYRLQRGFWVAMVVGAVLLHLLVIAFSLRASQEGRTIWLFDVSMLLAALYALGCAATLFALEREAGTYGFQRSLPVSASGVFFSKVTFAVASTAAMLGVLFGLAWVMSGRRVPDPKTHVELWALWGPGVVEVLAWGTLFSLLLRRPLGAAVLAVACELVVFFSGMIYLGVSRQIYLAILPMRAVVVAAVAVATIVVGHRWFRERLLGVRRSEDVYPAVPMPDVPICSPPRPTGALRRLVWQQARQSAGMLAVLSAMIAPLCLAGFWLWVHVLSSRGQLPDPRVHSPWNQPGVALPAAIALVAAPLAGACVFLGDQRRRGFRFLAERGVSPGHVWLSRHLVWLVAVLCWAGLIVGAAVLPAMAQYRAVLATVKAAGSVFGFVVLAYAAGQLASMVFSSGIQAGFFGTLLTALVCFWAGLMGFLGVPWLWSVAPIPLVLLVATRVRTPGWLLERNTPRAWLPVALWLAVPAVVIAAAACAHRVYSIPRGDPGFDPQAFDHPVAPEARVTRETYRRALDLYEATPESGLDEDRQYTLSSDPSPPLTEVDLSLLAQNEAVLDMVLEATQKPCDFFDPTGQIAYTRPGVGFDDLGHLVVNRARQLQSQGDLDAALDHYLAAVRFAAQLRVRSPFTPEADRVERYAYDCLASWAAAPDQTAERLGKAIERLEPIQQGMAPRSDAVKLEYVVQLHELARIAGGFDSAVMTEMLYDHTDRAVLYLAVRWLPWERARTRRVMRLVAASELKAVGEVETAVRRGQAVSIPAVDFPRPRVLHNTFPLLRLPGPQGDRIAWTYLRVETRRRAVILQLALAGWRAEHGELPARLEELAGTLVDRVPRDPFTGRPFEYFPQGAAAAIRHENPWLDENDPRRRELSEVIVPAGEPCFQSQGRYRCRELRMGHSLWSARGSYRDFIFPIPRAR